MKSKKLICGIDVSKDTLDTYYNDKEGKEYSLKVKNNKKGYVELIKKLGKSRTYIMESTGVYSLGVSFKLKKSKADVRVENPLVIKRFIQMNMERQKTDKSDAKWIYKYGKEHEATIWHLPSKEQFYCLQILRTIDFYKKHLTMLKNFFISNGLHPVKLKEIGQSIAGSKRVIENEITKLENLLDSFIDIWCVDLKKNLLTIPSIGNVAASYLIVYTDAFTKVQNHRQLIALNGTSPREHTSGTSISTKKGICKMGYANLRKTLYLCSWSAIRCNQPCKAQYERLKANGKHSKVALIAVCNKLLRQAFAIATSGIPYQADYISRLSKN